MEPDPVLVSNTREWLLRAKEDLDNAQHDLMATPPFVRDALFHCQQGVEKAMKALLAPAMEDVTPLTEYAARFRYPGAPWEPTLQEAQESIELAGTFFHTILKRLPPRIASFDGRSKGSVESGA